MDDGKERRESGTTNGTKGKLSSASYIVGQVHTGRRSLGELRVIQSMKRKDQSKRIKTAKKAQKKAKGAQQRLASGPSNFKFQ